MRHLFVLLSIWHFAVLTVSVSGPLTDHFQQWLKKNNYGDDDFARLDYGTQGSFGGKESDEDKVDRVPIIFIHGNSDSALTTKPPVALGFTSVISHFVSQGYKTSELYVTSWQDNDVENVVKRTHDCATVGRLRRFLQAVLEYTNSAQVNIISHSMGVTLARKMVKGGMIEEMDGNECNLGDSLGSYINTHIGIAGGNNGLCNCQNVSEVYPTCNKKNGFWPGDKCGNSVDCRASPADKSCKEPVYSKFLMDLNDGKVEASLIFSVWSKADELIKAECSTWGRPTPLIFHSHGMKVYDGYNHLDTKDLTAEDLHFMIEKKALPYRRVHEEL